MSRLIRDMEAAGLVRRRANEADARSVLVCATQHGRSLLDEARSRRLARLQLSLGELSDDELELLQRAAILLAKVTRKAPHPDERR